MPKVTRKIIVNYCFIFGNHPALGLVEVLSSFTRWGIMYRLIHSSVEAAVIELNEFLPEEFIEQLGGTVKIGQIIEHKRGHELDPKTLAQFLISVQQTKKIYFGLSQYRLDNFSKPLRKRTIDLLGSEIKNLLKEARSIRWVTSKEKNLSAVVVTKNKLITSGAELLLLYDQHSVWIARTITVQPFEAYSFRDYGRVEVDAKVGMLPPKLAQMMINISLAKSDDIILDPFCGYGTVLQEALLMGFHHVVGSDIAKASVDGSKKNLLWLKKEFNLKSSVIRLFHSDARSISEHVRGGYINTIVTEPHLGPAFRRKPTKENAIIVKNELEALYYSVFLDFSKFLRSGARIVMVWPVYILSSTEHGLQYIDLFEKLAEIGFIKELSFEKDLHMFDMGGETTRDTLIYGRPNQHVWREIVVFTYKKP